MQAVSVHQLAGCRTCAEPLQHEINSRAKVKAVLQASLKETLAQNACNFCTYLNSPDATACAMCSSTLEIRAEGDDKELEEKGGGVDNIASDVLEHGAGAAILEGGMVAEGSNVNRQCTVCTYLNRPTTNICEMCYTSLSGKGFSSTQKLDILDPSSKTALPRSAVIEKEIENFQLHVLDMVSQDPSKVREAKVTMLNYDVSNYFQKEQARCPICESACMPGLGHFEERICASCFHAFCDGCNRELEQNCTKTESCPRNPHCHHPKNCVFHLRDVDTKTLKKLLYRFQCPYKDYLDWLKMEAQRRECDVEVIAAENTRKKLTWLCKPYKEYIISIINKHNVDPAVIMSNEQLTAIINRELGFEINVTKDVDLLQFVQMNCPMR